MNDFDVVAPNLIFLPQHPLGYQIDVEKCVIYTPENLPVESRMSSENKPVVFLDWYRGKTDYPLKEVVCHCLRPVKVPIKYWSYLSVGVLDGNEFNLDRDNLVWMFPKKLGNEDLNGFSYIPGFTRYTINSAGVIYDLSKNRFIKARVFNGYVTFSLVNDLGVRRSLSRHRAISLVFNEYPVNYERLQVNHINGVKGDDRPENLEWCTGSENRKHAVENGLVPVNKPVILENRETGEIREFRSLREVCDLLSLREATVSKHLRGPNKGYQYLFFRLSYKFEEDRVRTSSGSTKVIARNLKTKMVLEFDSISECAKSLGLSKDTIKSRSLSDPNKVYRDFWQIKRKDSNIEWIDVADAEIYLLEKQWAKVVLVKDLITEEVREFETQRSAAKFLDTDEVSLYQRLKKTPQALMKNESLETYYLVQLKRNFQPWRDVKNPKDEFQLESNRVSVLVEDAATGTVSEFKSLGSCALHYGLKKNTLWFRLQKNDRKVYPPGLIFTYK